MLLKRAYGYRLHIPPIYSQRKVVKPESCLYNFLYSPGERYHYKRIQLNLASYDYYAHTELVMRGFLTKEILFESTDSWSYIHVSNPKSDKLCLLLRKLNPKITAILSILYGKRDDFLELVPVEALNQFFPQYEFETFINLLNPCCEIIKVANDNSDSCSLVSNVFHNDYYLRRFISNACFYLEDVVENYEKVKTFLFRVPKPELSQMLTFICKYLIKQNNE